MAYEPLPGGTLSTEAGRAVKAAHRTMWAQGYLLVVARPRLW